MEFKGFYYWLDSSLLIERNGDEIKLIDIFAKNQKDLKQFLKILKNNNDKGTLKITNRVPGRLGNFKSWEDLYSKESRLLQEIIRRRNKICV